MTLLKKGDIVYGITPSEADREVLGLGAKMKKPVAVEKVKVYEVILSGVDPYQPIEYIDIPIRKGLIERIKFVWPKPKAPVKKWYEFWKKHTEESI